MRPHRVERDGLGRTCVAPRSAGGRLDRRWASGLGSLGRRDPYRVDPDDHIAAR